MGEFLRVLIEFVVFLISLGPCEQEVYTSLNNGYLSTRMLVRRNSSWAMLKGTNHSKWSIDVTFENPLMGRY